MNIAEVVFNFFSGVYRRGYFRHLILVSIFMSGVIGNSALQARGIDEQIKDAFMPIAVGWENLVFTSIDI